MADVATPNLPSADFGRTAAFYARLGFDVAWRDEGWMILTRGALMIEFYPDPFVDPLTSGHGCCLRLDDVDTFVAEVRAAGVPEARSGQPRLHGPERQAWGGRVGALVDPDGSLLRLIGT